MQLMSHTAPPWLLLTALVECIFVTGEGGTALARPSGADEDKQQEKQRQFAQFLAGDNPGGWST
jgi:hypothetical protein